MKTSGLLCRATPDCDAVFTPADQSTMPALLDAAKRRDAHEVEVHGYHHRATAIEKPNFAAGPRPRARRSRDLDPVV